MSKRSAQHLFSQIPRAEIQRSNFNRSHGLKTTFDSGYLVPIYIDEVLPGDTFNLKATLFGRLATPVVPFMDNLYLETFFFFVPNRLLWDNWQKFNGEQENPGDSTDFLVPTLAPNTWQVGSLADYFGIPTGVNLSGINALPFRAYNLVYNEWFRDENLQDSVPFTKGDGPDPVANYKLLRRGKRHDYFTSCLPWPQKGPGVEINLAATATLQGTLSIPPLHVGGYAPAGLSSTSGNYRLSVSGDTGTRSPQAGAFYPTQVDFASSGASPQNSVLTTTEGYGIDMATSGITANLTNASAITINSLREAFQLQRLYERDARGGTRYTEILRAHFGVVSPDARLQRPEFLGGSSTRININPVQQTSATDGTTPQGNLAAYGVMGDRVNGFVKSFVEHGYIIGLCQVRADLTYQQGLNRMWSRQTRFDFYWPALAHLGEQAVLNKEIYAQGNEQDNAVFGYQERWAEYRYYPSQITGKFRSTDAQSLDVWHLAQEFSSLPQLNAEFIQDNPPVSRVVAVPSEPQILLDCFFNLNCVRPMPVYSTPGLVDHF